MTAGCDGDNGSVAGTLPKYIHGAIAVLDICVTYRVAQFAYEMSSVRALTAIP